MSELLKRITRYTNKSIGIIVDRHAPPPSGKLTVDPEGEYMEFKELKEMVDVGLLIELTPELNELHQDGYAQRGLIRDIGALGYESFDQVMEILRRNRDQILQPREFEVWNIGWRDNGGGADASLLGKAIAHSFREACEAVKKQLGQHKTEDWRFDSNVGKWRDYCGYLVDNESKAREFLG